jgi:hypothetical protein
MIATSRFTNFAKMLCTTFFLCTLFSVQAQTEKNKGRNRSDETQFNIKNLNSAVVDKSFRGISIKDVVTAIEANLKLSKGKYETTSDFARRVDAIAQSIRVRGNALNKPIAIVVDMNDSFLPYESANFKYHPDSSEVELYVSAIKKNLWDTNNVGTNLRSELNLPQDIYPDVFNIHRQMNSESSYAGSNSFGLTVKVRKYEFTQYGLVSIPVERSGYLRKEDYVFNEAFAARIQLSNAEALKILPSLAAILVFQPKLPYLAYDFISKPPTIDSPTDLITRAKYLSGELLGVVFISKRDGTVIHRIPERFGLE